MWRNSQHDRLIAGDEFDLRDVALAVQGFDERRHHPDLDADLRDDGQALAQVGDETRVLLAEADQGLVLLLDPAHREAALAAVAPAVADQRRQHRAGLDVADPGQVVHQHPLLGHDLLRLLQMLQHAAGADAEMRAARGHPLRRRLQHLQGARLVEMAVARGRFALTTSPGSAPVMKVTLPPSPSRRATPRPSWLRSRMSVWKGVRSSAGAGSGHVATGCGQKGCVLSQIPEPAAMGPLEPLAARAVVFNMGTADMEAAPMQMTPRDPMPRFLLVEDDTISRGFFKAALETLPAQVDTADSLATAMDARPQRPARPVADRRQPARRQWHPAAAALRRSRAGHARAGAYRRWRHRHPCAAARCRLQRHPGQAARPANSCSRPCAGRW